MSNCFTISARGAVSFCLFLSFVCVTQSAAVLSFSNTKIKSVLTRQQENAHLQPYGSHFWPRAVHSCSCVQWVSQRHVRSDVSNERRKTSMWSHNFVLDSVQNQFSLARWLGPWRGICGVLWMLRFGTMIEHLHMEKGQCRSQHENVARRKFVTAQRRC